MVFDRIDGMEWKGNEMEFRGEEDILLHDTWPEKEDTEGNRSDSCS